MAYLSVIVGILLASPVIFYEVIAFIKPALYDNEKKVLGYYLGSFLGLVTLGVAMAFFFVIPISFRILIYFTIQGGATPFIFIKDFYNWIYTIFVLCGVFYTIPIFVVMLIHVGVLPDKYVSGRNKMFAYIAHTDDILDIRPRPHPSHRLNHHGALRRGLRNRNLFRSKNRPHTQKKKRGRSNRRQLWSGKKGVHIFPKERLQILQHPRFRRGNFLSWVPAGYKIRLNSSISVQKYNKFTTPNLRLQVGCFGCRWQ